MTPTATFDGHTDLAKRAAEMLPLLDRWAHYSDEAGELAPEVVEAFHREGMFQMWVPRALGGSELGPIDSLEVLEITSYGDPSAGWVQMASCLSTGTAAAYLGPSAVDELFHDGGYPVIAGQGTRPGTARTVEGGYLLTGEWSFGSGLKHGTYIHSLGIIEETGEPRIFVTPVDKATLLQDSWDVLGLRGTGSIDYTMTDVFVPEEFCHFAFTTRRQPRRHLSIGHHRDRGRVPLRVGDGCRAPAARRAASPRRGEEGTGGQHRRVRSLPDAVRRERGSVSCGHARS